MTQEGIGFVGKVLQSIWLSLDCCGMWIKLHSWTWDLGKVVTGDVESHQHMGGSRNYRSDLGEDGVRTDEVQDRTCECPHLGGHEGMGTNEERIKERESINQIKEGSPELRRLKKPWEEDFQRKEGHQDPQQEGS